MDVSKPSQVFHRPFSILEAAVIGFGSACGAVIAPSGSILLGTTVGSLLGGLCIAVVRYWFRHTRPVDQTAAPPSLGLLGHITYIILLGISLYCFFLALNATINQPNKKLEGMVGLLFSLTFILAFIFFWIDERAPQAQDSGISLGYIIIDVGFITGSLGLIALGDTLIGILGVLTFGTFAIVGMLKRRRKIN